MSTQWMLIHAILRFFSCVPQKTHSFTRKPRNSTLTFTEIALTFYVIFVPRLFSAILSRSLVNQRFRLIFIYCCCESTWANLHSLLRFKYVRSSKNLPRSESFTTQIPIVIHWQLVSEFSTENELICVNLVHWCVSVENDDRFEAIIDDTPSTGYDTFSSLWPAMNGHFTFFSLPYAGL